MHKVAGRLAIITITCATAAHADSTPATAMCQRADLLQLMHQVLREQVIPESLTDLSQAAQRYGFQAGPWAVRPAVYAKAVQVATSEAVAYNAVQNVAACVATLSVNASANLDLDVARAVDAYYVGRSERLASAMGAFTGAGEAKRLTYQVNYSVRIDKAGMRDVRVSFVPSVYAFLTAAALVAQEKAAL